MKPGVVILALAAAGCAASPPPAPAAKPADVFAKSAGAVLRLEPSVTKGKLANGLTYYIRPNRHPDKRVQMWLAVNVGSIFEDEDQRGLAHFIEHMAFNGTRRFPKNDLIELLERSGVRFGADVNAYTSFDQTVYQLQLPTDRPELVGRGLMMLRDWADGVTFDPAEVDKERKVVVEEWRMRLGPGARIDEKRVTENTHASRYTTRPPIGKMNIVTTAPPKTLQRFYRDWYRPDLMAVVVVGDVDAADLELRIGAEFASFKGPKPERQLAEEHLVFPGDAMTVSVETDPELTEVRASITSFFPHRVLLRENDYRHRVVERLWNTMMSARLGEAERKPGAAFSSAQSSTIHPIRPIDGFVQTATLKESGTTEGLSALFRELIRAGQQGFLASELARAKTSLLRSTELRARRAGERDSASLATQITKDFTSEETLPSPADEVALLRRFLPEIGLIEMNNVTGHLAQGRRISVTGPASMTKPSEEAVRAALRTVITTPLPPYVDVASPAPLMARPTARGPVVGTRAIPEIGVTEWTLVNGVRVVLRPTERDTIRMHAFAPGGTSLASDADFGSARFAGELFGIGGLGGLDADATMHTLAGTSVRFRTGIEELGERIDGSALANDTEMLLQLSNLAFTGVHRDPAAFVAWRDRLLETRRTRKLSPDAVFAEEMTAFAARNNPRRRAPTDDELRKVDPDKALAFYKDRFSDASNFTFVFTGAIDPEQLQPLVETYLGTLPQTDRRETWRDPHVTAPRGIAKKEVPGSIEPKSRVRLTFHGDTTWSHASAYDVQFVAEILQIRLREILREDMGGVYTLAVEGNLQREPHEEYAISIHFVCAPENADRLVKAVLDEAARLGKAGVADDYVQRVREIRRREQQTTAGDDAATLRALADAYRHGEDPRMLQPGHGPPIGKMTADRLRDAARTYLDAHQYLLGISRWR